MVELHLHIKGKLTCLTQVLILYMKIQNVKGSSKISSRPPSKYSSWLNYWEEEANFMFDPEEYYNCPSCGELFLREDFDGCHVQK